MPNHHLELGLKCAFESRPLRRGGQAQAVDRLGGALDSWQGARVRYFWAVRSALTHWPPLSKQNKTFLFLGHPKSVVDVTGLA